MAPLSNQQFKAFVGIDWADTKHDICLQQAGDDRREFDCIPHQVTRIDEWAKALHQRFGGPIAIALELARGPIVSVLQRHAFFTLFPINPAMLAKYREAFKPSRAKDDPTDAELARDLLLRHPERFSPLRPQSAGNLGIVGCGYGSYHLGGTHGGKLSGVVSHSGRRTNDQHGFFGDVA